MKLRVLLFFLCLVAGIRMNAQCTPNFNDSATAQCGVVQFTNMSTSASSFVTYSWSFPSAVTPTSTLTNPTATYVANGIYTVCLTMNSSFPSCSATICQTINVSCFTATNCSANFNFSCSPSGTNAQVFFSNTSVGTNTSTQYDWDLGNLITSTVQNPTGTYTANGTYVVCLNYTTNIPATCMSSICQTINIGCIPTPSCAANFGTVSCVSNTTNGTAQVSFANLSSSTNSPIVSSWTFGNSTFSNNIINPNTVATYTANGSYNVCLSISSGSPACQDTLCQIITVTCVPAPQPTCQANFSNTPCNNGQSTFYSTSTGTNSSTQYTWTNSGPPNSTTTSYTVQVCLKMKNNSVSPVNTCSSVVCKTVTINCAEIGFQEFATQKGEIKIFPNPNDGLFTVDINALNLSSSIVEIKVFNVLGELVHRSTRDVYSGEEYKEISLQNLANGAYYLRLSSGGNTYSTKLVIAR
jgi:PKD repeat protein